MAESLNLLVSVGSDFHRSFEYGPTLGVDTERLTAGRYVWNERAFNGSAGSAECAMSNGPARSTENIDSTTRADVRESRGSEAL
jgi:hypothetical protein